MSFSPNLFAIRRHALCSDTISETEEERECWFCRRTMRDIAKLKIDLGRVNFDKGYDLGFGTTTKKKFKIKSDNKKGYTWVFTNYEVWLCPICAQLIIETVDERNRRDSR